MQRADDHDPQNALVEHGKSDLNGNTAKQLRPVAKRRFLPGNQAASSHFIALREQIVTAKQ